MSIIAYWNKLKIYTYSALQIKKPKYGSNTTIICFFGMLGDAVMFLDALNAYISCLKLGDGKIVVACRSSVIQVFMNAGFANDVIFEELNREAYLKDFKVFKKYTEALNKYKADLLLHVRASYASEDAFIHAIKARKKICVRTKDVDGEKKLHAQFFLKHTYTEIINADESEDQLTHYGIILKRYWLPTYKSKVFEMPTQPAPYGLIKGSYILICPGASIKRKAWPAERFAQVVNNLPTGTIVLSGDQNDEEAGKTIENLTRRTDLINLVGKSSLQEWFGLVQNAKLVLANESGAVHVAAASKVPCVCIGAQEFGETFLPYRPEFVRKDDHLPFVVRGDRLSCFYCKKNARYIDTKGQICYLSTGTFPCLENIAFEKVLEAVRAALQ